MLATQKPKDKLTNNKDKLKNNEPKHKDKPRQRRKLIDRNKPVLKLKDKKSKLNTKWI
jgi:hypothetical protein